MQSFDRSKIKVLHILTNFSIGGATENTIFSVDGLQKLGYDIKILTGPNILSEGNLFQKAKDFKIKVEICDDLKRKINLFFDFIALIKIYKKIKKENYSIVHTHSSKAGIIGRLAAKLAGVPIIIHTIHGLPFHEYQNIFLKKIYIMFEKFGAKLSDKLITVTSTIINKALIENIGDKEKYKIIRSGFETNKFIDSSYDRNEIRKKLGIKENDIVVGKIARFSKLKGHKFIIDIIPEIVKKIPNVKFLFIGSGELENTFREKVKKDKVEDHVVFAGLINIDEIPEIISVIDLIVHTSLLEGLARVLPQALAACKPVVAFDIDGAHEVVINERTGYLIEPKNSDKLAQAIFDILTNVSKAKLFGSNGRCLVEKDWTISKMVNDIDETYKELIFSKKTLDGL